MKHLFFKLLTTCCYFPIALDVTQLQQNWLSILFVHRLCNSCLQFCNIYPTGRFYFHSCSLFTGLCCMPNSLKIERYEFWERFLYLYYKIREQVAIISIFTDLTNLFLIVHCRHKNLILPSKFYWFSWD